MKKILLISVLIGLGLVSCRPDLFELNRQELGDNRIFGLNMSSDFENIDFYADNAMRMNPDSRACMTLYKVTDLSTDMTVKLLKGQGLIFYVRTNCNYFPDHPSISLEYRADGYTIKEDDRIVVESDKPIAAYGEKIRLVIHNYAKSILITSDCDTLCRFETYIPNTEYLIIETLPGSSAEISGIIFSDTDDWEDSPGYMKSEE